MSHLFSPLTAPGGALIKGCLTVYWLSYYNVSEEAKKRNSGWYNNDDNNLFLERIQSI